MQEKYRMNMLKKIGFLVLFSTTLLTTNAALSQTLVRQMEGVSEYKLANGLQVLLVPNDLQPRVYANLTIKAGSSVEGLGEGGMAHLLEHLLFKGTPTTKDPMKEFSERSFASNGTTNQDRTNYFASMNANTENLHWYIGWLADAMTNSFIAKADLDKEMSVVRNEFERAGSNISRGMWDARMALTFPNHGYGRSVLGNLTDIENVSITKLQAFYKTWYRPDNAVLVVSGRFDTAQTLAHIQRVFGTIPSPQTPLPKIYTREPVQDGAREATIRREGGGPQTIISWRGAPAAHPDDAVLDVVAHALTGNSGSRFRGDVTRLAIGTSPAAFHSAMAQYGLFNVSVLPTNVNQFDSLRNLLQKNIDDIAKTGITEEELTTAKTYFSKQENDAKSTAESMGSTLAGSAALGDWRLLFWGRDNLAKVSIADTQRVAAAYLVPANEVRVFYSPETTPKRAPDAVAQSLADYIAKPIPKEAIAGAPSTTFVELERFEATSAEMDKRTARSQLAIGTKVALLARPAVGDAIQGTIRLRWGNLADYKAFGAQVGAASNVAELLSKGTNKRSQKQITDDLNRLQSSFTATSGLSGLTINFKTTRQHWPAFAELMTEVLREPKFMSDNFSVKIFESWKLDRIARLNTQRDEGEAIADRAITRAMSNYGSEDPRYIPTVDEAVSRWKAVELKDMQQFWRSFAGANVSQFAASGALDVESVQQLIKPMFEGFAAQKQYERIAYPLPRWEPIAKTITTPDKPNALLLQRRAVNLKPYTKEAIAVQFANGIIGATSASRLFTNLRKQEGLTYGTYSGYAQNDEDEVISFGISGTFAPQNRERFEQVLADTKKDIITNGLTQIELFAAKRVALERTKTSRENDVSTAATLAFNEYQNRNFSFWQKQSDTAQSITIEEVNKAAKLLLDANDFVTVVTGDFSKK
jgi:zinc protease